MADPASISLYAASFEDKDVIEQAIADYNETKDDLEQIQYTDYIGLMLSSITTIINAITYVLIAFVAVSLVVSSIMIGVITLISVQERTKEIGILRAIGASKRNVSSMFNAETVIIGFTSGALGVLITWVLCIPINAILHHLTGIQTLSASCPAHGLGAGAHQHRPDLVLGHHPLPQRRQERPCGGLADGVDPGEILLKKAAWLWPGRFPFAGARAPKATKKEASRQGCLLFVWRFPS